MARYYKSRFLTEPEVYIQEGDTWCNYAPRGETRVAEGEIPEDVMKDATEISEDEADDLIVYYRARAEGKNPPLPPALGYTGPTPAGPSAAWPTPTGHIPPGPSAAWPIPAGPKKLGGFLIVAIVWLALTVVGGSMMASLVDDIFRQEVLTSTAAAEGSGQHAGWVAMIVVNVFGAIALVATPIVILMLMGRRRRSTPRVMVGFCCFAIGLAVFELVIATTFGLESLRAAGFDELAGILVVQVVSGMIGAVMALVLIPYFLISGRVKDTFTGQPAASPAAAPTAQWPEAPSPGAPASWWPSAGPPQWEPLPPDAAEPPPDDRFCAQCGAEPPPDDRFCARCGRQLRRP